MQVTGTIRDFCLKCYSCSSPRVYYTQAPGGPIVQHCENCHKLWHACAITKRIVIPSPRTPTYITCECVLQVVKVYGNPTRTPNKKPADDVQMHEKQLAQLLEGGDNPDTYAEEDYRLRKQMEDHMEKRTTPKPIRKDRKDPKDGDVALEDYRLNEADKCRREKLADVVRAKIESKRHEASEDYRTIQRAEEDVKVDAEVEKMIDAQLRLRPSFSSRVLAGDSTTPKPEKATKDPRGAESAWEEYLANEAEKYRNAEILDRPGKYPDHDVRPLKFRAQIDPDAYIQPPENKKAAPKPGFDVLSQFMYNEAQEHRVNVESGIWDIAVLCDPEVTLPSNTTKTNLGRPGPGPCPMGAR